MSEPGHLSTLKPVLYKERLEERPIIREMGRFFKLIGKNDHFLKFCKGVIRQNGQSWPILGENVQQTETQISSCITSSNGITRDAFFRNHQLFLFSFLHSL